MSRFFAVVFLLAVLGVVRVESVVLGLMAVGSAAGVYALVRVLALERRWERESSGNLDAATEVHAAASQIDREHRGTDA